MRHVLQQRNGRDHLHQQEVQNGQVQADHQALQREKLLLPEVHLHQAIIQEEAPGHQALLCLVVAVHRDHQVVEAPDHPDPQEDNLFGQLFFNIII